MSEVNDELVAALVATALGLSAKPMGLALELPSTEKLDSVLLTVGKPATRNPAFTAR